MDERRRTSNSTLSILAYILGAGIWIFAWLVILPQLFHLSLSAIALHALIEIPLVLGTALYIFMMSRKSNRSILSSIESASEQEDQTKAIFEQASEGMIVSDRTGKIINLNQRASDLFGYQKNDLLGNSIELLLPEDLRKKHVGHRNNYHKDPKTRTMGRGMDLMGRHKNGNNIPVEISLSAVKVADQQLVISFIVDISQRKQAELALIENEEKLRLLNSELESRVEERTKELENALSRLEINNVNLEKEVQERMLAMQALRESQRLHNAIARNFPNGTIYVIDRNLEFVFAEGQVFEEKDYHGGDLIGKPISTHFSQETMELIHDEFPAVFSGKNAKFEVKVSEKTLLILAVPLPEISGAIPQILVVTQNITEVKKAEEDIRNALEKEKELNEFKSRFVSMASHEFKTPLSAVLTSATLLGKYQAGEEQEKRNKHINRIKSSVRNLTLILNDFLSLGKLEEGKIENNPERFDIEKFSTEIVNELQEVAEEDRIIKYSHIGERSEVVLDKFLARTIMTNLLSNALKYSFKKTEVSFLTERNDSEVIIIVSDRGIGISEEDQQKLFQVFFRAKNSMNHEGTGLGLNIIKQYVDLLGGTIEVESELNIGTRFTIKLPN